MSYTSKYTGPEIDNLLDKIVRSSGVTETSLWAGNLPSEEVCTINLSQPLSEFDELGFYIISNLPDGTKRYLYRVIPTQLIMNFIENETNSSNSISMSWGYSDKDDFLDILVGTTTDSLHLSHYINDLTKVVGIKYNLGSSVSSSNPIGAIVPIMGTQAPKDHLICDGSVLNINEYKELADYFEKQFGSNSYFGGDGITTFAVPDLRNEFLRGYHGDAEEQLSEDIGIHQDATEHVLVALDHANGYVQIRADKSSWSIRENPDKQLATSNTMYFSNVNCQKSTSNTDLRTNYTSRPTNVAVLFCIKYTESDNANGRVKRDVLWQGVEKTVGNTCMLAYNIEDYDELYIETGYFLTNGSKRVSPTTRLDVESIKANGYGEDIFYAGGLISNLTGMWSQVCLCFTSVNAIKFFAKYEDGKNATNTSIFKVIGIKY